MGSLANSDDPDEMPHYVAFHIGSALFVETNHTKDTSSGKKYMYSNTCVKWPLKNTDELRWLELVGTVDASSTLHVFER